MSWTLFMIFMTFGWSPRTVTDSIHGLKTEKDCLELGKRIELNIKLLQVFQFYCVNK